MTHSSVLLHCECHWGLWSINECDRASCRSPVPSLIHSFFKRSVQRFSGKVRLPRLWLEEEMTADDLAVQGAVLSSNIRYGLYFLKHFNVMFRDHSSVPDLGWTVFFFKWFSLLWCQMGSVCFLHITQDNPRHMWRCISSLLYFTDNPDLIWRSYMLYTFDAAGGT